MTTNGKFQTENDRVSYTTREEDGIFAFCLTREEEEVTIDVFAFRSWISDES